MIAETKPHLLSFVTDTSGDVVSIHLDLQGITLLIEELRVLQAALELGDCPHTHLFPPPVGELTQSKIANHEGEDKSPSKSTFMVGVKSGRYGMG